jgi:hypothetical protein
MIKEIYLVKGEESETFRNFKKRITDCTQNIIRERQPITLKFTITDRRSPRFSVIPFRRSKIAAISIVKNDEGGINTLLRETGFYGAYRVTEALPVAYTKTWADKMPTPGLCLLTLFRRKKGIDHGTFISRWHNSHTPLSLCIHPLWNYVRNVVDESLTKGSAPFERIVEENFKSDADLLNPFRFFGNPLIILHRMLQVYTDTKAFIDYPSMETYLTTEYHMKS